MVRGVRQGCPAGGFLFAMAFDPIFRWLHDSIIPCLLSVRTCFVRAVSVLLYNSPDKDWNCEEKLEGLGLEECPLLHTSSVGSEEPSDA